MTNQEIHGQHSHANVLVPTFHEAATINDQKATTLQETFFDQPPPADLSSISKAKYPEAI